MKDTPIIMSGWSIPGLLSGRKSMTRRIVKWRNLAKGLNLGFSGLSANEYTRGRWVLAARTRTSYEWRCEPTQCPWGLPGDQVWVRESWSTHACFDHLPARECPRSIHYWADGKVDTGRGRSSLHMPRWASRITRELAGVRVERLQAITADDALAEGIVRLPDGGYGLPDTTFYHAVDPRQSYFALWEHLHGAGSVESNPFVWVLGINTAAMA